MFPGPGRSSPVLPNSSGGKGHHSHGHSGHRRESKRETLSKSQSNPSLPVPVPPQAQATPPSGAVFFPAFSDTITQQQQQQQHSFPATSLQANVGNSVPSTYQPSHSVSGSGSRTSSSLDLWGEVDGHDSGRPVVAHKQPVLPLWREGWKASSITCSVPKLYQPQPSSTTTAAEPTMRYMYIREH